MQKHKRFLIELLWVVVIAGLVWGLNWRTSLFHAWLDPTFSVLGFFTLVIFFGFAYYGTAYEVTPSGILLGLLRSAGKHSLLDDAPVTGTITELDLISDQDSTGTITELPDVGEFLRLPSVDPAQSADTPNAILKYACESSTRLATKMEKRSQTYLIIALFVGVVGVLVWYYSFQPTRESTVDGWTWVRQVVPRLSILLFVELLAGFFLRQYRIGVEDFKHFFDVQRKAENNRVAFAIIRSLDDVEAQKAFASGLATERPYTRLQAGETTTALEAMKVEDSAVSKVFSKLSDECDRIAKDALKPRTKN